MELRLQPKPEIDVHYAEKGIVSREKFFVKKKLEEINRYFYPGHLIRNWRPKADLIYSNPSDETAIRYECDFNREVQNCFVEDFAEEVYLRSPPPCFVILGKPGPSVENLGRQIAEEYGSVLISVEHVVDDVIRGDNETAKFVKKVLRTGSALTVNVILSLVSFMIHSTEARHRGYVLCGFPCPSFASPDVSVGKQLDYLFCWENKPTFFIYLLYEDEDLLRARFRTRYELEHSLDHESTSLIQHFEVDDEDDSGCATDNEDDEEDGYHSFSPEPDINVSPSRPWIQLPKDLESFVWLELELYDKTVKPAMDLLVSRVDPQYCITVDSRVKNEFELVKSRLSLLQIWKVPVAFPFISPKKENEEENLKSNVEEDVENDNDDEEEVDEDAKEIESVAEEPPEKAFLTLFTKKTPSAKFRWELSHYNYICPVALRAGEVTKGKSRYAVVFMKYIYFMKDEESMKLFLKNPRPFVLPIRPRPPTRFIIIGYPYCGKTTLAEFFAEEFSIPVIDLNTILSQDLEDKMNAYLEYCRQKAESRELIRLTAQAWRDWRLEEEQRLALIEDWMEYVQSILNQRIEEFYSGKHETDSSCASIHGEDDEKKRRDGCSRRIVLQVQGVPIELDTSDVQSNDNIIYDSYSTPSAKLIKAFKHEDYDFDKKGFEVEANLFFSALWNSFPNDSQSEFQKPSMGKPGENKDEDDVSNRSLAGEDDQSVTSINWCHLLPPQSLSSLLLNKKGYTVRERRKSFRVLLAAASKAHRNSDALKTEFAKWRLPCFMDIPLCEILVDNPALLYKYCPDWIKQMPLMPEAVDPNHPAVIEAGRLALTRAKAVNLQHTTEEIGILLRNAIEKAERDRMRVTCDILSPGGWVVDNMVTDIEVWCMLLKANIIPTQIYCLVDSTPEFRRIINTWYSIYEEEYKPNIRISDSLQSDITMDLSEKEITEENYDSQFEFKQTVHELSNDQISGTGPRVNIITLLLESCNEIAKGEEELDVIFDNLISDDIPIDLDHIQTISIDPFSHNVLRSKYKKSCDLTDESMLEEFTLATTSLSSSARILFSARTTVHSNPDMYLGAQLQRFTSKVFNILQNVSKPEAKFIQKQKYYEDGAKFFYLLLTVSHRLEELKEWLKSTNRGLKIIDVDIKGKSTSDVFTELLKDLNKPFGKRPRELEAFEVEEIDRAFENSLPTKKIPDEEEGEVEESEEYEDVRIYGESGPFCIVNLERNILLRGNPKIVLRYYGKLYFFWDNESKLKFLEDPEKYAPYYSPIRCLPPLRIYLVGPIGGDKAILAQSISNQFGIHSIDYIKFLSKKLIPHVTPALNKLRALNVPLLVSETHSAEAKRALAEFKAAPYKKRQFWLENPPFFTESWVTDDTFKDLLNLNDPNIRLEDIELVYQTIEVPSDDDENETTKSIASQIFEGRPYFSMNDIKKMLENYIHDDGILNDYCIDRSLKTLWNSMPYAIKGFVLKDFPLRSSDSQMILENNWIPDLVIHVDITEDDAIENNIDRVMESWDIKLKQQIIEEQLLEDSVRSVYETKALVRRFQLTLDKTNTGFTSLEKISPRHISGRKINEHLDKSATKLRKDERKSSLRTGNGNLSSLGTNASISLTNTHKFLGSAENREVDELIHREFPSLIFNPKFESYEEGKARIKEDMSENYRKDVEDITKLKATLQGINVPWVDVKDPEDTTDIFLLLNTFKKRINQKSEFAFEMSLNMAENLLEQGFYFLSKFGRLCPVQAYRRKNPIHMYRPHVSRGKVFPVAYRNYIYFIGGENEKTKFLDDPIKYTFNEPHFSYVPLRISVIGPPKSGKSTLCQRLSTMFDLKVVTMGSAIRFVLERMTGSALRKSINNHLKRGCFLPLSLKVEALIACLHDPSCVTQGFIFDGVPFDAAMAQSLAEKRKLPFVILCLTGDANFGKQNRQNLVLSEYRLPYKQRVNLDTRYKEWKETYEKFKQWNKVTYKNLQEMNAKSSILNLFYQVFDIIKEPYFSILDYVENCITDKPLKLQYLCVTQQEYEARKTALDINCPVCWAESNRLLGSDENSNTAGLVYYVGSIYWVCSGHMSKFLSNPKKYMPPNVAEWPVHLPRKIDKATYNTIIPVIPVHGFGRCPVTRIDFPQSLSWEGSWNFAAIYKNEVFLCKNAEMLERFLALPWRYYKADTVFEKDPLIKSTAVENLGPPKITSLPPIGFLEQTVADLIHKALHVLGTVRPVYPDLSPTCTACIFVALYLKVHNHRKSEKTLEKEYLDFMIYYCKAYRFKVPFLVPRQSEEEGQGDYEVEIIDSIESTNHGQDEDQKLSHSTIQSAETSSSQEDIPWMDLDFQADKKLWSAKYKNPNFTEMLLDSGDELQEISILPSKQVVVRYRTTRTLPLPPIDKCLTYLYIRKPPMAMPEAFNINMLFQANPSFQLPHTQRIVCNPERQFSATLLPPEENVKTEPSDTNLWRGKRTTINSEISDEKSRESVNESNSVADLCENRFMPRFHFLDIVRPKTFPMPNVIEYSPIIYEPQRDYTFIMLMSNFFRTTHIVKCFDWMESKFYHEYTSLYDRGLGLCNARSQFFYKPEVKPSVKSRGSTESYMQAFDASNTFFYRAYQPEKECSDEQKDDDETASIVNFMQVLILDKLDEIFAQVSLSDLSYDSYEMNILSIGSETSVKRVLLIREILPFPPLIWDIDSRPYYAFSAAPVVFSTPHPDNIAHERHVSLLDGIVEPYDTFRFVRFPTWVEYMPTAELDAHEKKSRHPCKHSSAHMLEKTYFFYDFFHLNWTSFLCYPFSWAYDADITSNFNPTD
ncbi:hypothetical protein RUM44_006001 [Polyplax serrata]|uniref:Adenylate kinase 9 n=1 Tax=Polyplax serrata TaxID=468196 RepID=A0ABR1AYQ3_POLSC